MTKHRTSEVCGCIQCSPEWKAADALAQANFQQQWGDRKQWRARKTNRAFYRRIAAAQLRRTA